MSGRPTKLTPEVQAIICDSLSLGVTYECACARATITTATLYNWMNRGQEDGDGIYFEFFCAVKSALAEFETRAMKQITIAAMDSWQAAAWQLERRFTDRYGRKIVQQEISGPSGGPVRIALDELSDEKLAEIAMGDAADGE